LHFKIAILFFTSVIIILCVAIAAIATAYPSHFCTIQISNQFVPNVNNSTWTITITHINMEARSRCTW